MKKRQNYLDKIPFRSPHISHRADENGIVTLQIENSGFYNRIAQRLFKKPVRSFITLDETGSFVWLMIDGKKSVYEIGVCVEEHFGKEAEPLFERLVTFLNTLGNNGFIKFY